MKKRNVLNLIRYHTDGNNAGFRNEAYTIAESFYQSGDLQLSEYIMALLSESNTFVPQILSPESAFLKRLDTPQRPLPLPDGIAADIKGVLNAIGHNAGINKYLFQGHPGTGKTETAKQIARLLGRDIFIVDFSSVIDSRLGQTSKNISSLFEEINSFTHPNKTIVLFDEIDALALDRTNSNDLREMGRATSSVLSGFDCLNENVVLIATTNLFDKFDKALIRRFDAVIDFNQYTQEDLLDVADSLMTFFLSEFNFIAGDKRLTRKILMLADPIPNPGELKNLLKTSIAFSDPGDKYDYLRRLYRSCSSIDVNDVQSLSKNGFTLREIEILTGISRSTISRELRSEK